MSRRDRLEGINIRELDDHSDWGGHEAGAMEEDDGWYGAMHVDDSSPARQPVTADQREAPQEDNSSTKSQPSPILSIGGDQRPVDHEDTSAVGWGPLFPDCSWVSHH